MLTPVPVILNTESRANAIICSRLSTIQAADRIIVMENGSIVEVCSQLLLQSINMKSTLKLA